MGGAALKRAICLLLLIPLLALGQLDRMGHLSSRHHLPSDGLAAAYFMGPDGELNSLENWTDRARNALVWSEDLTERGAVGTPVVTVYTVEDDDGAAYEALSQVVAAPDATTYTWTFWVLKDAVVPATRFSRFYIAVDGVYYINLDTSSGATTEAAGLGGSHTVTTDGASWKVAITFMTDDGNGILLGIQPAIGANADLTTASAAAVGTITILKQQLNLGSTSLEYEVTEARQRVWDWSGNANHATVGPTSAVEAGDPGDTIIDPGNPRIAAARGEFDGVDDYLLIDNTLGSALGNDQGSILVLVRPDAVALTDIFSHGDGSPRTYLYMGNDGSVAGGLADTADIGIVAAGNLDVSQWSLVGLTWSGGNSTGYLNGTAAVTDTYTGSVSAWDQDFKIGVQYVADEWDGDISLFAIYSRALNSSSMARAAKTIARYYCSTRGFLCDWLGINPWEESFSADFGL